MAREPSGGRGAASGGPGRLRARLRARLRPPPVWRAAPRRLLHDPVGLVLMVAVLALVAASAAAGPLYAEAVADASVRLTLASVPDQTAANARPVVRVNGGVDPAGAQRAELVAGLDELPGVGPPRVTVQSVSTELHPKIFYDPVGTVLTSGRGVPGGQVRVFGVDDPADRLVVVSRMPGASPGVWLPEPVAAAAGVAPGDEVRLRLSGLPEPPTASAPVAGVYAVEEDGRTPRSPPGQRLWADLGSEGFPSDTERSTLRARLLVADLATAGSLARRAEDQLLWSAHSVLDLPRGRLDELHRAAEAVAGLRRDLATRSDLADGPVALRPSLASGVEDLARRADGLAAAAQQGAAVTTRLGIVLALALVAAAAGHSMARRGGEVRLAAGLGRRPVSAGLLHVAELLPAAALGALAGWFAARVLVTASVGTTAPSTTALVSSALWCLAAVGVALVVAGAVAAVATRLQTRRLEGRPAVAVPWVLLLVAVAVSATVALLSRPPEAGEAFGPLDLLVPPLLMAALAAVGSRLFFVLLRRRGPATRPPTRRSVTRWLARRRLQAPDRGREATTTIAATGLAMLVFSVASLGSLEDTVEDRAAVEVGAHTVHRPGHSWRLDPAVPAQASAPEDDSEVARQDVPVARNPPVPAGQAVVWRTRTNVVGTDASVSLLVVDPVRLDAAAAWGSAGGPVAAGRTLLPALAAEDAQRAAATRRDGLSAEVPALLVGTLGDLALDVGSTVTVETLNLSVRVVVRGVLTAFPGVGTGQATLVLPADSFFAAQLNDDPRLRPARDAPRNRPTEFQADLWSSTSTGAAATLSAAGVAPVVVGTLAQVRVTPLYTAAGQARRYQVALGLVLGALGLAAVALAAVRLARRAPAADRMVAWSGAGRNAPALARAAEVGVVLALSGALGVAALWALHPLAGILLEPGDGRTPEAVLAVPGAARLAAVAWLALTALVAGLAMALAARSQPAVEVLRGED